MLQMPVYQSTQSFREAQIRVLGPVLLSLYFVTDETEQKGEVEGINLPCYMLHPFPNPAEVLYLQCLLYKHRNLLCATTLVLQCSM